jgi:hypothetical protein
MKRETLEKLTSVELCDLLVENTILLLESLDRNADGVAILDLQKKVELLQEIIKEKRSAESC